MPSPATTWLHVSGYRFLLRRIECALLFGDVCAATGALRARTTSLALGCVLAIVAAMGCAFVALLRPQSALGQAPIVMGRESGALYVRVDDVWHPVLNLASARLIAATNANPQPVSESELGHTKRGPLLGIPGAPQLLDQPLAGAESAWAICDSDNGGSTTVVVGPAEDSSAQVLTAEQMILVATESGSPTYLLYGGRRAVVDLADPAVVWALRLQGRVPHVVAQSLLNAVPEAPRITAPRIRGGGRASVGLPGFLVGGVVRITRASGDEYYVVLEDGVQRIGQVAADLLRFGDSQGSVNVPTVAPDVDSRRSDREHLAGVGLSRPAANTGGRLAGKGGHHVVRDLDARAAGCCSRRVLGGQRPAGAPRRGSGDTGTSRRSRPRTGRGVPAAGTQRLRSRAQPVRRRHRHALPGHRHRGAVRDPRRRRGTRPRSADGCHPGAVAGVGDTAVRTGAE